MAHAAFNWQDPFLLEQQLSDDERMHALNALGDHYAAGRLDSTEFYDRSADVAAARTLGAVREPFRGLPGGLPLEQIDGHVRKVASTAPANSRNCSLSRLATMRVLPRGVFSSCATPATRLPSAASFSTWTSCIIACRNCVI